MSPLLSPEQVAVVLGVPVDVVEQIVSDGELSFYAVGPEEVPRFSERQVQDYLDSCERTMMDVEEKPEEPRPKPVKPLRHLDLGE